MIWRHPHLSSWFTMAVSPECPTEWDGNNNRGCASLRLNLTFTTRADDNHAPPSPLSWRKNSISRAVRGCQDLVRFFALLELNHMLHRLCGLVNSFEINLVVVLPRRSAYALVTALNLKGLTPSTHRLRRGTTRVSNCLPPRFRASASSCESCFRQWCSSTSTHFTATHGIPHSLSCTQVKQFAAYYIKPQP